MASTMRGRADLEQQHAAALAQLGEPRQDTHARSAGFASGVADGLEWVLGLSEIAPITLARIPWPTAADLATEHDAAQDVLYGRRDTAGRDHAWIAGVEHALLWAYEATPAAPIFEVPELRPGYEIRAEMSRLRQLVDNQSFSVDDRRLIAGSLATLAWVVGDTDTAPLSGRIHDTSSAWPSIDDLEDEADLADKMRYGDGPIPPAVSRRFVAGVDQALRWVERRSERSAL